MLARWIWVMLESDTIKVAETQKLPRLNLKARPDLGDVFWLINFGFQLLNQLLLQIG